MADYEIQNLSFRYPGAEADALQQLSFRVLQGSFTVLLGPSGCGKTTLLRLLKPQLQPNGTVSGVICYGGRPVTDLSLRESSEAIGFVQQNPETQLVTDKVWHELAFGLESLGLEPAAIRRRTAEMASFFGIQSWFHRPVEELSGGQKQLLNLAAVMVMQPEVLILDEPTSQLDPIAASEFLNMLERLNRELGTTIILSEHRLEQVLPMADQAIVLENGYLKCMGAPRLLGERLARERSPLLQAWPAAMQVWAAADAAAAGKMESVPAGSQEMAADCANALHSGPEGDAPISIREGRAWLQRFLSTHKPEPLPPEQLRAPGREIVLEARDVWFRYTEDGADVVSGLQLRLQTGSFSALLGGNGTGKTTTLKLLAGLKKPIRGKIRVNGKTGMLPQNPQTLFLKNTVQEELLCTLDGQPGTQEEKLQRVREAAALTRLEKLLQRHPYDLSGGEQQRAALAKLLLCEPELLLLDEPTRGMDAEFKDCFAKILNELLRAGKTILMVSHDVEFCARYCDHCYLFFDGSIAAEGTPRSFFAGNSFYTTACSRMARLLIPGAVTVPDLIACLGGTEHIADPSYPGGAAGADSGKDTGRPSVPMGIGATANCPCATENRPDTAENRPGSAAEAASGKAAGKPAAAPEGSPAENRLRSPGIPTALYLVGSLLAVALTLWAGLRCFGGRKYYFISLLILLEAIAPFFLHFEQRKPQARELVVLAVLSALGVAGRAIFFMLPQFKPVMALTILAGAAMGAESGFLVGSATMLASNMLFSQGPWTPWQMAAMGLVGFLAGLLFSGKRLIQGRKHRRLALSLFGIFAAIVVYGGIMNPASALMWSDTLNPGILLTYYISGFPMDCVQAAATAVFLWFLTEPMLEKLERVQVKYGLPVLLQKNGSQMAAS